MGELDKNDLWIFAGGKERTYYKDFVSFCKNKLSRQTMTNCLKELQKEGKLKRALADGERWAYYFVPEEKRQELEAIRKQRQFRSEVERLSFKGQEEIVRHLKETEMNEVLMTLALEGPLKIPDIAERTGLTESKVHEAIWAESERTYFTLYYPMLIGRGLVLPIEKIPMKWGDKENSRTYILTVEGLYMAIRREPEDLDQIARNWGHIHPFIFKRLDLFREYGLEDSVKSFLRQNEYHGTPDLKDDMKRLEDDFIDYFSISGEYIENWLRLLHADQELRERVKKRYEECVKTLQGEANLYKRCLKTIDMLSKSKPDWEELKWHLFLFNGLSIAWRNARRFE